MEVAARHDMYCTAAGCFPGPLYRDDVENPWPSMRWAFGATQPDPRIPAEVVRAWCGPAGCGPLLLPLGPPRALQFAAPPATLPEKCAVYLGSCSAL